MTDVPEATPPTAAPALKPVALRPRDAATLIIVERGRGKIRVLMGKRHAGHKFMPGKFVFPGGAVEPEDSRMIVAGALDSVVEAKLLVKTRRTSPEFARSLALAAIRETFEETGLALGVTDRGAPESPPEGGWTEFAATGVFPTLEGVDFLARAITPPGRVRRFDARFFVADASMIAHRGEGAVHPDAELVELTWIPIEKALELDIPLITRTILGDLSELGSAPPNRFRPRPFYRQLRAQSVREEL
jgi:8-oxo-dGTP pyrophosphatase MutT (NUDIX family)